MNLEGTAVGPAGVDTRPQSPFTVAIRQARQHLPPRIAQLVIGELLWCQTTPWAGTPHAITALMGELTALAEAAVGEGRQEQVCSWQPGRSEIPPAP